MWANGRVGIWAYGHVGMWACGHVGMGTYAGDAALWRTDRLPGRATGLPAKSCGVKKQERVKEGKGLRRVRPIRRKETPGRRGHWHRTRKSATASNAGQGGGGGGDFRDWIRDACKRGGRPVAKCGRPVAKFGRPVAKETRPQEAEQRGKQRQRETCPRCTQRGGKRRPPVWLRAPTKTPAGAVTVTRAPGVARRTT